MQETFTFLGLSGYSYGLWVSLGALLSLCLMCFLGRRVLLPKGTVLVYGALAIPLGILCSRVVFCLCNLSLYTETYENPLLMLRIFDGGLSMTGALAGLVLAVSFTARLLKYPPGLLMDVMVAPLGLFIMLCRAAESFTPLGVGKVVEESAITTAAPWLFITEAAGVTVEYRLAVYRYEAAAALLIFILFFFPALRTRGKKHGIPGDAAALFFSLYGASQIALESLRDDGHLLFIFLRVAQVGAVLMPIVAATVFSRRYARIRGVDRRIVASWIIILLSVAACVLLEFSLDGRLSWGPPSILRDTLLEAALSIILFAVPFSLFRKLRNIVCEQRRVLAR
ncbi:MAG: prolipoprotein diacylglyceryl transferase [Clostridia bacterium]|nr:prolipoprotein diacylglyceryl transferase [Clostridia bacterium]